MMNTIDYLSSIHTIQMLHVSLATEFDVIGFPLREDIWKSNINVFPDD